MEFNDIHIGMKCGSKKGSGTVTFEVGFEEIIEDPQAHNKEDTYY